MSASPGRLRPAWRRPLPLYLRIWLAVVLAVALLTLFVALAWRYSVEPPLREAVLYDAGGDTVGRGPLLRPPRGPATRGEADRSDDDDAETAAPRPPLPDGAAPTASGAQAFGPGPVFALRMDDGRRLYLHLPRPAGRRSFWSRPPFGFFWTLALVGLGVALATWPIVRKLTRGLERLQASVERWGAGDLSARAEVLGRDETALLAQRFNLAAERIEALVASHKSLLANASHELRSPLARIRMGLELLQGGSSSSSSGGAATPALRREIERNVAELDQLIDEILLASRLDAREADVGSIEPVDLVGIAAEECAHTQAEFEIEHAAGAAAGTSTVDDFVVPGVARLLRRAVRNLLENARRYGGDSVRLTLARTAGSVHVMVSDRGPGIAPDERERIFEPFYRARGASERSGGVGLGLALVKSIAGRHGGRVRCEEQPGGGARFVLELPIARSS